MIKNICVITPEYPSDSRPYMFTFVDQLVCAIADMGIEISVITPHDLIKSIKYKEHDRVKHTRNGATICIYSPMAITLTTRKIGILNMSLISEKLFNRAVKKTIQRHKLRPDVLYAHFLFPAGTCVAEIGEYNNIPSVCAFGESSLWSIKEIGLDRAREQLRKLSGVIAVSTSNKNILINNGIIDDNKIRVIPNAVDQKIFCPGNKEEARKKLGLPAEHIIGLYNGTFSESKGSLRVDEATRGIEGLKMVYIGGGKDVPSGDNILYKGRVAHEEVPTWLQAADFFVLPTLEEGCCNAVIEAMSTGLPIITSDKSFNYDILDSESAMLIDPLNIDELRQAITILIQSPELRESYSKASINKAQNLDIHLRAKAIVEFLEMKTDVCGVI